MAARSIFVAPRGAAPLSLDTIPMDRAYAEGDIAVVFCSEGAAGFYAASFSSRGRMLSEPPMWGIWSEYPVASTEFGALIALGVAEKSKADGRWMLDRSVVRLAPAQQEAA